MAKQKNPLTGEALIKEEQKEQIPQVLRVWLRYRSEKYFGAHRTPPKSKRKSK